MPLIFDISAKLVQPNQKAWVVHAGRSQGNYSTFVENNCVFLEVPNLQLDSVKLSDVKQIRQAIRRSQELTTHLETTSSKNPSDKLTNYSDSVFDESALTALTGSIGRLYGQAKKGDLVIVPGIEVINDIRTPLFRFGEFTDDFDNNDRINGNNTRAINVPIRNVHWLNKVSRKKVTTYIEKKIAKPPAVRTIILERDTEEILKHAYESYIFEGNSSSLVVADKYDGSDFLLLNQTNDLIAFLIAAYAAYEKDPNFRAITDIKTFTNEYFKYAPIENIETYFASPGYWRIAGASVSLAAFVSLGISLFSNISSADDLKQPIIVTNSTSDVDDGTNKKLQDSANYLVKSMERLQVEALRQSAHEANEKIGLKSTTLIRNDDDTNISTSSIRKVDD